MVLYLSSGPKKVCTTGFSLRIFNGTLTLQNGAFPQRNPNDRAWLNKREAHFFCLASCNNRPASGFTAPMLGCFT